MKINEIFYSIQGEGLNIGMPQIFIRFFGCNLRCVWCDTAYSHTPPGKYLDEEARKLWRSSAYKELSVSEVLSEVTKYLSKNVCITGGEPMCQQPELLKLLTELAKYNYYVQLFTNGTFYNEDIFDKCDLISMDMKPPSSGMKSDLDLLLLMNSFYREKCEIKVVIQDEKDLEFALKKVYPKFDGTIILQPEGGTFEYYSGLVQAVMSLNLKDIRLLPQLHKLYGWK